MPDGFRAFADGVSLVRPATRRRDLGNRRPPAGHASRRDPSRFSPARGDPFRDRGELHIRLCRRPLTLVIVRQCPFSASVRGGPGRFQNASIQKSNIYKRLFDGVGVVTFEEKAAENVCLYPQLLQDYQMK